jgi:hypothetical protein
MQGRELVQLFYAPPPIAAARKSGRRRTNMLTSTAQSYLADNSDVAVWN